MKYKVSRTMRYDFLGQSYASKYPNLHKYPATMIPQVGIEILKELNIHGGTLLDPYCGSGSSFVAGMESDIEEMYGYDINPLAALISKARFTKIDPDLLQRKQETLRETIYEFLKKKSNLSKLEYPDITNIDYWFSKDVAEKLLVIKKFIEHIAEPDVVRFFMLSFSETIRECSYTRNNEFKLYRIKPEDVLTFNPDAISVFFSKLNRLIDVYRVNYYPRLNTNKIEIRTGEFKKGGKRFDIVLTSPPYGDSRTTVAYGQFSTLSNEWMGIKDARKIDSSLMGGKTTKKLYQSGIIASSINEVAKKSEKRAFEVSAFYFDLQLSIREVAGSVKKGGYSVYVVGNRRVKDVELPTDQFIAEQFAAFGYEHIITHERLLSSKSMPSKNSPSNVTGVKINTMLKEYIVVSRKK